MSGKADQGGQEPLELAGLNASRPVGSTEAAVREATAAAQLDPADRGAAEVAASLARGMDLALGRRDPYAVAAVGKPLTAQLHNLHMDPAARADNDAPPPTSDPWDKLVDELRAELAQDGAPADGHPAGPAH